MISIITTFFNAEKFIESNIRSVQSIIQQDMIEHILVDDGSTDQSSNIVSNYVSDNVSFISKGRLGRAKALNLAISKSRFRYLCILDADDLINPLWISYFIHNVDKFVNLDKNTTVFFGRTKIIDANTNNVIYEDINSLNLGYKKQNNHMIFFRNPICHSGTIIDRESFTGTNIYNEKRKTQLDWDLWFRIINLDKEFIKFDCYTGSKRIHSDQFFEKKAHTRYLFSGIILQLYWTIKIRIIILPLVVIASILRFFWGFLPSRFRTSLYDNLH